MIKKESIPWTGSGKEPIRRKDATPYKERKPKKKKEATHETGSGNDPMKKAVLRIRIHMFLGLLDPDQDLLVRGMDPDRDPSLIKEK